MRRWARCTTCPVSPCGGWAGPRRREEAEAEPELGKSVPHRRDGGADGLLHGCCPARPSEVFETPEAQPGAERSFSTFGKEKALHSTLERKELDGLLSNTRAPYKPPYLSKYYIKGCIKVFPLREESSTSPSSS